MTEALKTELVNFTELSDDASCTRKEELTKHVATLFALTSDRCSDEQVEIYDSVLLRLVDMVEAEVRRYVAEQLSSLRRGPEGLIRRLADDDISVAEPILLRSPVLQESDLIRIAESRENSHRFVIAQREALSEQLTDVLVREGDLKVRRKVASNDGASLSDAAAQMLISDSASDATLQLSLSKRNDLAEAHIKSLVAVASKEVRRKLLEEGRAQEAEKVDKAADIAAQRMSNQYWLDRYDFDTARSRVALLAKRGIVNEAVLRRFASENLFAEAVVTFAWLVQCEVSEIAHSMVRQDPDPFIVFAKAAGFSSISISPLLNIGPWQELLTPEARIEAMTLFESMTVAEVRREIAEWNNNICH